MDRELCSRCEHFNIQAFERDGFGYRGYPLTAVVHAAHTDGCSFCSMLIEHLTVADRANWSSYLSAATRSETGQHGKTPQTARDWRALIYRHIANVLYGSPWVHLWIGRGEHLPSRGTDALNIVKLYADVSATIQRPFVGNRVITPRIELNVAADPDTPASTSQDITGRLFSEQNTWSWSYPARIQNWHAKCRRDHPDCNKTLSGIEEFDVENARLPNRCIEVWTVHPDGICDLESLRWVLRETEGQTGKYIALSHRWDDSPATKAARTLKENYACRLGQCGHTSYSDCTVGALSPLFLQTAQLALNLGVKYVWIDSVCIIQLDAADWDREAANMADYYQFAWLTISATATKSGGWLFGQEMEAENLPRVARLPYRNRDGEQEGHFYVQCTGHTRLAMEYYDNVSKSTLLRRGWVYQEWLLSRRLITFSTSSSGLFMQCQSAAPETATGDTVAPRWKEKTPDMPPTAFVDKGFKKAMGVNLTSLATILDSWETVVETYSGQELTMIEQDRLVALAGVASEFDKALRAEEAKDPATFSLYQYRYACGYWTGQLRGLLWEQAQPGPRVRVKGIPTWSWASMASHTTDDTGRQINCGMRVQWTNKSYISKRQRPKERLCRVEHDPVFVSVDPATWQPRFDQVLDPTVSAATNRSGNERRFAVLQVRGRLRPVRLHTRFACKEDADTAAVMTGHKLDFGRDMWRPATVDEEPGVIAGWASIEHPEYYEAEEAFEAGAGGMQALALFVTRVPEVTGGFGLGNWRNVQTAFTVLLLKRVDVSGYGGCYERLGVGRLFGKKVEASLEVLREDTIRLI